MNIKKVLFPTDFSQCANQALTYALHLAEQKNAELHMLHAVILFAEDPHNPTEHFPDVEEFYKKTKESADLRMGDDLSKRNAANIEIKQAHLRGISAGPAILEYSNQNDIDLIVMGTHGRRGISHFIMGSVAEEIIRTSHCPVMTIRCKKKAESHVQVNEILVPVDFSQHAKNTMIYAKEFAALSGARLRLLHVIEQNIIPSFYMDSEISSDGRPADLESRARREMEKLFEETAGPSCPVEINIVNGHPAQQIVRQAEQHQSDLIMISTHGLTGVEHLLLGSVTEKVIRLASCPVFTVKPFGKSLF